jgi:hypothetical protein
MMIGMEMNIKWAILGAILVPAVLFNVVFVDVSDRASEQLSSSFKSEWDISFKSATLNRITSTVTLKEVVFPANAITAEMISYTHLDDESDVLPDNVSLSIHNAKGLLNLVKKHYSGLSLEPLYSAAKASGLVIDDVGMDLTIKISKSDSDVGVSIFVGAEHVQNITASFKIDSLFPVLNGGYGRYMRGRLYGGNEPVGFVDGVGSVINTVLDAKGLNIKLTELEMTHRVVNEDVSYEMFVMLPKGSHVDELVNVVYGHRNYFDANGGMSFDLKEEVDLAEWLSQPVKQCVPWLIEKGARINKKD